MDGMCLSDLPSDCLMEIALRIDVEDTSSLSRVNRAFASLLTKTSFWTSYLTEDSIVYRKLLIALVDHKDLGLLKVVLNSSLESFIAPSLKGFLHALDLNYVNVASVILERVPLISTLHWDEWYVPKNISSILDKMHKQQYNSMLQRYQNISTGRVIELIRSGDSISIDRCDGKYEIFLMSTESTNMALILLRPDAIMLEYRYYGIDSKEAYEIFLDKGQNIKDYYTKTKLSLKEIHPDYPVVNVSKGRINRPDDKYAMTYRISRV